MSEFDWVTERHKCATKLVFDELRRQVEQDVIRINALDKLYRVPYNFSLNVEGEAFAVGWEAANEGRRAIFSRNEEAINVSIEILEDHEMRPALAFYGQPRLSEGGQLIFVMDDGKELAPWQFRRAVLEDLFFKRKLQLEYFPTQYRISSR